MYELLSTINDPADLRSLDRRQLAQVATELRQFLIESVSQTGGHLSSNLGTVELTIALHRVFQTPHDKFVWDVSHQVYVHKILTGRKNRFRTIRQTDGLNGFALRSESPHDCFGAGHAGTALSAALGMCAARDQRNRSSAFKQSAWSPAKLPTKTVVWRSIGPSAQIAPPKVPAELSVNVPSVIATTSPRIAPP